MNWVFEISNLDNKVLQFKNHTNYANPILRFRWRDTTMLPLSTENLEQTAGYGLHIRRVGIRDLG